LGCTEIGHFCNLTSGILLYMPQHFLISELEILFKNNKISNLVNLIIFFLAPSLIYVQP
jgi:hypothetical protein